MIHYKARRGLMIAMAWLELQAVSLNSVLPRGDWHRPNIKMEHIENFTSILLSSPRFLSFFELPQPTWITSSFLSAPKEVDIFNICYSIARVLEGIIIIYHYFSSDLLRGLLRSDNIRRPLP